jgi:ribulose 1,5-bisphosphate synthetase/thiazole synthase
MQRRSERLSRRKESRMTNTENTTVTQALQNSDLEEFDLVILGGGAGSTVAAWTFAGRGQRVAVIERKYIGGS